MLQESTNALVIVLPKSLHYGGFSCRDWFGLDFLLSPYCGLPSVLLLTGSCCAKLDVGVETCPFMLDVFPMRQCWNSLSLNLLGPFKVVSTFISNLKNWLYTGIITIP